MSNITLNRQARQKIRLGYSPYGACDLQSLFASLTFNGQRKDPVTDCYALGNGYRNYSPSLMRFQSPDSLSPFGLGDINSYAYNSNDPINSIDPSGHVSFPIRNSSRYRTHFPTHKKLSKKTSSLSALAKTSPEAAPIDELPSILRNMQKEYKKLRKQLLLIKTIATEQGFEKGSMNFLINHSKAQNSYLDRIDLRLDRISTPGYNPWGYDRASNAHPIFPNTAALVEPPRISEWLPNLRTAFRNGNVGEIIALITEKIHATS